MLHRLAKHAPYAGKPILLWGDSFAPVNAGDAKLAVPHELKQPPHAEPMGALVVLLAALLLQFSKGTTFLRPTKTILLRAKNVVGLKMRASVLMAGVQIAREIGRDINAHIGFALAHRGG